VVAHRVAERTEARGQHLEATIVAVDQAVEHYEITLQGSVIARSKRIGESEVAKSWSKL
jgi:ferritin-like metal-binding protein YciE